MINKNFQHFQQNFQTGNKKISKSNTSWKIVPQVL